MDHYWSNCKPIGVTSQCIPVHHFSTFIVTSVNKNVMFVHGGWYRMRCWTELPGRRQTFTQCWFRVGPASITVGQRQNNIGKRLLSVGYYCFYDKWHGWREHNTHPTNTIHWTNCVLMLDQRRRRWTSIKTTLGQSIVLIGKIPQQIHHVSPTLG